MDKQRIYIPKATFQDQKKRDLAMLLLEAGYSFVHIGTEPMTGKPKAKRSFIEYGTDLKEADVKA